MQIIPKISAVLKKKHPRGVVISLDGKILGVGKDTVQALKEAKKNMPEIEKKEFAISRIHTGVLAF